MVVLLLLDEQSVVNLTNTLAIGYQLLIVAQEN